MPWLGLLAYLSRQSTPPLWVGRDYRLQQLLDADGRLSAEALLHAGLRPLLDGSVTGSGVGPAWRRGLRARLPRGGQDAGLDGLEDKLDAHQRAFVAVPASALPGETWALRRGLRERLRLDFRHHALEPLNGFLFLALVALDLERLRQALLDRALFAEPLAAGTRPSRPMPGRRSRESGAG